MRKLILRMTLTVDGMAAGEHGGLDGVDYADEGVWSDIFATLDSVDALVIGGRSQAEYFGHWGAVPNNPAAPASEKKFAAIAARTPHYVLSRTLRKAEWPGATLVTTESLAELKRQSGRDMLMWGGPTAAAAVIEAGLIDEYHLDTHPTIAGRGKRLFANVAATQRLRHLSTRPLPSGIVLLKYARA